MPGSYKGEHNSVSACGLLQGNQVVEIQFNIKSDN